MGQLSDIFLAGCLSVFCEITELVSIIKKQQRFIRPSIDTSVFITIIVKKLISLKRLLRTTSANSQI